MKTEDDDDNEPGGEKIIDTSRVQPPPDAAVAMGPTTIRSRTTATAAYNRCAIEQIEDGNDAAPCPFNSVAVEFEDR
eukprot:scaffold690_cov76-Skeletonema_dohrnii-CCMP3373.AAC.2